MTIERIPTLIAGCFELQPRALKDSRGIFVKTFGRDRFEELGLRTDWAEQYYSVSRMGVLRGLHFQAPPFDHAKLVYCTAGEVMDVAVDLRRNSATYGRHVRIVLSAARGNMVYLESGLAHGFCTLSDGATLIYSVTSVYSPSHDSGIRWDSVGIEWPVVDPILSERDKGFVTFGEFESPFQDFPGGDGEG